MYAPIGYVPFSALVEYANTIATQTVLQERTKLEHSVDGKATEMLSGQEVSIEEAVLAAWIICRSFEFIQPYICSPTGTVVSITQPMTHHEDRLGWYDWYFPSKTHEELCLSARKALEGKPFSHPFDRFRFIDVLTGTISVAEREHLIRLFGHDADEDVEPQSRVARNFEGWAICFDKLDFPRDEGELALDLGISSDFHLDFGAANEKPKAGRPSLQFQALEGYRQAFPKGHRDASWKVVEARVAEVVGRRISVKTIQRALDKNA